MYSVAKGYKVELFCNCILGSVSLLLEIIIFMPDLATRSFFKLL